MSLVSLGCDGRGADNVFQKALHKTENGLDYIGIYVPIIGSGTGAIRTSVALISTIIGIVVCALFAIFKAPQSFKEKADRLQFWGVRQVKIGLLELVSGVKWFAITKLGYDINSHELGHRYSTNLSKIADEAYYTLFPQDRPVEGNKDDRFCVEVEVLPCESGVMPGPFFPMLSAEVGDAEEQLRAETAGEQLPWAITFNSSVLDVNGGLGLLPPSVKNYPFALSDFGSQRNRKHKELFSSSSPER